MSASAIRGNRKLLGLVGLLLLSCDSSPLGDSKDRATLDASVPDSGSSGARSASPSVEITMPEDGAMWFPRCPFEYPYFRLEFFVHDFGLHPPPCAPRERCGYAEITGGLSGPPRVGDEPLSNTPGPGEPFIVNMSTRFGVSTITVTLKNHDDTPVIDDEGAIVSDRVQFTISPDQTNCSWPSGGSSGSMDSGGSGFGGAAGSGEAGEGGMAGA